MAEAEALIKTHDLTKIYPSGGQPIIALESFDFTVADGEFVCLVGPSGAGKSTLIRLLILEERPTRGSITIAGRSLEALASREIPYYRRKVGVVFQDYKLLPQKTVYENIAFALEVCEVSGKEIHSRVLKILELVGLSQRAENYPDELSGGEKQRASIARALIHNPRILIADEPTGNLDPLNGWEIIELLLKINAAGTVVLLATHNQDVVNRIKKRVVVVRDGHIISDKKSGNYVI